MAIEIQRLLSIYEANTTPFERAMRELPNISNRALTKVTRDADVQAKAQEAIQRNMANASVKEQKRATAAIIAEFNKREQELKKSTQSSFAGSFAGTLAAGFVDTILGQIQQIPAKVGQIMDEAVKISSERLNAMKGLESIASFKGINPVDAQSAIQSLRLVKGGIVDVGEATTSLKNLLATGFSLPEAVKLLEAFSDAAAFGKQSALGYGEAIRGATEGLKNGNSILVDNVGITKNLSVILEEQGKSQKDLMNITSDASVRQAVFNGLLKEAQGNIGDADKLTGTYAGTVASLDQAYKNLYASGGDLITQSPEVIAAYQIQKSQVEELTEELTKNGSETQEMARQWISAYAKVKAATYPFMAAIKNEFMSVFASLGAAALGVVGTVTFAAEGIVSGVMAVVGGFYNSIAKIVNGIGDLIDQIPIDTLMNLPGGQYLTGLRGQRLKTIEFDQVNKVGSFSGGMFEGMKNAYSDAIKYEDKFVASVREMRAAVGDVGTYTQALTQDAKKAKEELAKKQQNAKNNPNVSDTPSSGKKKKGPQTYGETVEKQLRRFNSEQGFVTGRTFGEAVNPGSLHPSGMAMDSSVRQNASKTVDDWTRYTLAAIEAGWRVVDERLVGFHKGVKSTAPNVHLEKNTRKGSMFLPQSFYSIPVGMLKEADEKRLGRKGGYSAQDVEAYTKKQAETQKQQDEVNTALAALNNAQMIYGKEAIRIPQTAEEIIKAYKELREATRQRLVNEIPLEFRGDPTKTRERQVPWQLLPGNEWGLQHQGDPTATRPRVVNPKDDSEFMSLKKDLNDQLFDSQRRSDLTEFSRLQREIADNYKTLDPLQKQELLNIAQQIDTQNKLNDIIGERITTDSIMQDAKIGAVHDAYSALDNAVGSLVDRLGLANTAAGNFFQTMLSGLARMAAQKAFEYLFGGGAATTAQSSSGGWLSKLINIGIGTLGAAFGSSIGGAAGHASGAGTAIHGFRAGGGDVMAGHNYIIGESGWEVFTPKTNGTISNQSQLSKGNSPNVTIVNNFVANQNGAFSEASASQAARKAGRMIQGGMSRI